MEQKLFSLNPTDFKTKPINFLNGYHCIEETIGFGAGREKACNNSKSSQHPLLHFGRNRFEELFDSLRLTTVVIVRIQDGRKRKLVS